MSDTSPKPTVPEVLPLVRDFYQLPGNEVGGHLHIVLDDDNVEDHHVQFCLTEAEKVGDQPAIDLARLLLRMSKTQRKKVARTHTGYERQAELRDAGLVKPYYTYNP